MPGLSFPTGKPKKVPAGKEHLGAMLTAVSLFCWVLTWVEVLAWVSCTATRGPQESHQAPTRLAQLQVAQWVTSPLEKLGAAGTQLEASTLCSLPLETLFPHYLWGL